MSSFTKINASIHEEGKITCFEHAMTYEGRHVFVYVDRLTKIFVFLGNKDHCQSFAIMAVSCYNFVLLYVKCTHLNVVHQIVSIID